MFSQVRKLWGSDQSKKFKLASWGIALGIFGVLTYFEMDSKSNSKPVITHHGNTAVNKKADEQK